MDIKVIVVTLILCCGAQDAVATVVKPGTCSAQTKTPMKPFNVSDFAGHWYHVFDGVKLNQKCFQIFVTVDNRTVEMTQISYHLETGESNSSQTLALLPTDNSGKMKFFLQVNGDIITLQVSILDTDYTNYAVMYGCSDHPFTEHYTEVAVILGRRPKLNEQTSTSKGALYRRIDEVLISNGLEPVKNMVPSIQDCGKFSCKEIAKFSLTDKGKDFHCSYPSNSQTAGREEL